MMEFLGIGAQKAGTTWLHGRLRHHPDIWTCPAGKEIHYFDTLYCGYKASFFDTLKERVAAQLEKVKTNKLRMNEKETLAKMAFLCNAASPLDDAWYTTLFSLGAAKKNKVKGDITPNYCTLPAAGIAHVKRLMPAVRIIYMIRDPLDRAVSSMRMTSEWFKDDADAVMADPSFADRGDYAANIPRWEAVFDPEQILYLPFGAIRTDPEATLRRVEAHIGLTPFGGYPELEKEVNSSKDRDDIVTDAVRDRLHSLVQPMYGFLESRFGAAFMAQIK